MATSAVLEAAQAALAAGDWSAAQAGFGEELAVRRTADALDGLSRALWWSHAPDAALGLRAEAYAAFRRAGRTREATRAAVWLAREYRSLYRNDAVADGWLARARSLADHAWVREQGWIVLAEAEATADPQKAIDLATRAIEVARAGGDPDLEVAALARCGVLQVSAGDVEPGINHVNEAMAAATAGEPKDPQYVGEAFCALTEMATLLGDAHAVDQWATVLTEFHTSHDYAPLSFYATSPVSAILSTYCGSCCGAVYLVTGRLDEAEDELTSTVEALERAGLFSRCVHPVTQLAELRIAQGRLTEAQRLLTRYEDLPECTLPLVSLEVASGRLGAAAARLASSLESLSGRPLSALPLWSQVVDVQLALGNLDEAEAAAREVARVGHLTGTPLHRAESLLAQGMVATAHDDPRGLTWLREASRAFGDLGLPLAACRARLAYARGAVRTDPGLAVAEARASLNAFERLGATLHADEAAALLRQLGVKGRTGPKRVGTLSRREQEVLGLVSEGMSNAEIGERLFISTKTAGHHVSSILTKLGLRSRTEAAAYAALHLPKAVRTE